MRNSFCTALLCLPVLFASLLPSAAVAQDSQATEGAKTPPALEKYLGRTIAQTMHYATRGSSQFFSLKAG